MKEFVVRWQERMKVYIVHYTLLLSTVRDIERNMKQFLPVH
jgi:hypothetical protein